MAAQKYVLLVDDDEDIREVIKEALALEGVQAEVACSGEDALQKVLSLKDKPSLILLDLMMPKTDGIWFCNERKKYPELLKIPTIILSADGQVGVKTVGLGITGIMKKPIKIEDLFTVVNNHLG